MTIWQKKNTCISVNYLLKIQEKIFFNKKLSTFAFLKQAHFMGFG
jgi:hypothetical protein